ncbi:MAG: methionyl-tRNA formyltransferase [Clostridia bacterium]|nr:methionyl-tRNA formyltransferase [Clostridia bacterium]MDD4376071.1 methionyl-tRNA formyltransferase [Clostridia bacterium]
MKKEELRIVFMGTPDFAKKSLEELVENGYNVVGVFSNPDKPAGRGMKISKSSVKIYAEEKGIEVYQPERLRNNDEVMDKLKEWNPNLIIVVSYGKILPKVVLDFPEYGSINVHGSLLPKYRGAAPIQWAIINGDNSTGITTMYMDEGMDTGDMIYKSDLPIEDDDTYGTLHDKMAIVGAVTLKKTLEKLVENNGKVPREKQEGIYTLAPIINRAISKIDFSKSGKEIVNLVRGLNPIPTAWAEIDEEKTYKIYRAEYITEQEIAKLSGMDIANYFDIGEIVYLNDKKNILAIRCKDGYINLIEIKAKNSKRMMVGEYIRGANIKTGEKFK